MKQHVKKNELTLLWATSQHVIASFIGSLVPESNDAEDILQEVALRTIRNFEQYDAACPFTTWAIGIAKNVILEYHRQRGRRHILLGDNALEFVTSIYMQKADSLHDRKSEIQWALSRCIHKLKARWQQVLESHYQKNQTAATIAETMELTESNVLVILHRSRHALRDCINIRIGQDVL